MECWGGSGFGIDINGTCPVLMKKKIQEISNQTLQGQGKGPTVGMKRDRVKRKKAGKKKLHVDMMFDLAVNQTCVSLLDRDRASSLSNMSLHS